MRWRRSCPESGSAEGRLRDWGAHPGGDQAGHRPGAESGGRGGGHCVVEFVSVSWLRTPTTPRSTAMTTDQSTPTDPQLEETIEVGAPPEAVWALVSDVRRMASWS